MSGTSDRIVYSWDTSVFLAWLKHEPDKPLADIEAVIDDIEKGEADLIVSTVVITELLDIIENPDLAADFQAFMKRPNIMMVDLDPRIARRTARLRSEWRLNKSHEKEQKNVKTPDAVIIVTAMMMEVTVLHSFDPGMHRHTKTDLVDGLEIIPPVLWNKQKVLQLPTVQSPQSETTDAKDQPKTDLPYEGEVATGTPIAVASPPDAGTSNLCGPEHEAAPGPEEEKKQAEVTPTVRAVEGTHRETVLEPLLNEDAIISDPTQHAPAEEASGPEEAR